MQLISFFVVKSTFNYEYNKFLLIFFEMRLQISQVITNENEGYIIFNYLFFA
jgi:hypothetical protein